MRISTKFTYEDLEAIPPDLPVSSLWES